MCEFCKGESELKTTYISIKLQKVLPISNKQLLVKFIGCPPYAECSKITESINNLFEINYCPMCR